MQVYENFKATAKYFFDYSNGNDSQLATNQHSIGYSNPQRPTGQPILGHLNPSFQSFKIVIECPLITTILLNSHKKYVDDNVPTLLLLMIAAISTRDPEHVSPHLQNHYVEFKSAQIKVSLSISTVIGLLASNFN